MPLSRQLSLSDLQALQRLDERRTHTSHKLNEIIERAARTCQHANALQHKVLRQNDEVPLLITQVRELMQQMQ